MDLRTYIAVHGLTAAQFARRANVSRMTVHKWLHAHTMPGAKMLARIAWASDNEVTPNDMAAAYEGYRDELARLSAQQIAWTDC